MTLFNKFTTKGWEKAADATAEEPKAHKASSLVRSGISALVAGAMAATAMFSPSDANAQDNEPEVTDMTPENSTFNKGGSKDLVIKTIDEVTDADFATAFIEPTSGNNSTTESVGEENSLLISPENQTILDSLQPGETLSAIVITQRDGLNIRNEDGHDTGRNAQRGGTVTITPNGDGEVLVVRRPFKMIDGRVTPSSAQDVEFEMDLIQTNLGYLSAAYLQFGEISNQTATNANPTQTVTVQTPLQDLTPNGSDTVGDAPNTEASVSPASDSTPTDTATQSAPENNTELAAAPTPTADQATTSPDTTDLDQRLSQLEQEFQDLEETLLYALQGFEQYDLQRYEREIAEATDQIQRLTESRNSFRPRRSLFNNRAARTIENDIAILNAHLTSLEASANAMRRDYMAYNAMREYYSHLIRLTTTELQLIQLRSSVLESDPNSALLSRIDALNTIIAELEENLASPFGPFDTPEPFDPPQLNTQLDVVLPGIESSRRCNDQERIRLPQNQAYIESQCLAEQEQIDAYNLLNQTSLIDFQNQSFQQKLQTIRAIALAYPLNESARRSVVAQYLTVLNPDEIYPGEILILASHTDVYPYVRIFNEDSAIFDFLKNYPTQPSDFIGNHPINQENIVAALTLTQRARDLSASKFVENYLAPDLQQKIASGTFTPQDLDRAMSQLEIFAEGTGQSISSRAINLLNQATETDIIELDEADLIPVNDLEEEQDPWTQINKAWDEIASDLATQDLDNPEHPRSIASYQELISENLIYETAAGKRISVTVLEPSQHENNQGLIFRKENGTNFAVSGTSLVGRLFEPNGTPITLNEQGQSEPDWSAIEAEFDDFFARLDKAA